jgi:membrane dipeptidase
MLIVDAHQDLAWNMLTFGRDYTRSAGETRRLEAGGEAPLRNGDSLLGWPDYQRGRIAVVFSVLFVTPAHRREAWETVFYRDADQAHSLYRAQLDMYHQLTGEHPERFRMLQYRGELDELLVHWKRSDLDLVFDEGEGNGRDPHHRAEGDARPGHPVGLVMLIEGAEGVREPSELDEWWRLGVRLIGPAWGGTRFCGGTREPGPLTKEGYDLLEGMADLGFLLDVAHMDEWALMQALDSYPGAIASTHANVQSLLKGEESNRHLSERAIRGLLEREAVLGVSPVNPFLLPGWKRGDRRGQVSLQHLVDHIDHICQLAGDAHHVGLGTDFDGGFGVQSVPLEIDTVADLQKLVPMLGERGYSDDDTAAILGGNWLDLLHDTLPEGS